MAEQDTSPYADALADFVARGRQRYTTPGHHGDATGQPLLAALLGERVLSLDIQPTVEGIDHGPGNPMEQSLELAARAWGSARTWFLANGSSQGNKTACLALAGIGTTIVAQRSVHSSVVDGLMLSGLDAGFVQPSVDHALGIAHGVTPASLEAALVAHPDAVAAFVVSPSYFGACADVAALADVAHRHGAALVVDEAWGAHLGFHPELPVNAVRLGADVVIASMHKLGGSLGQTALLHLGHGPTARRLEPLLDRAFRSLQSTSESSVLLASLDLARRQIAVHGTSAITASLAAAARLRERVTADGRFRDATPRIASYPDVVGVDPLRVVIDVRSGGISGHEARSLLFQELGRHVEMATDDVVVAVIGAGTAPDVDGLADALLRLPSLPASGRSHIALPDPGPRRMTVREAWFAPTEVVAAEAAVGRVSADSVAAYPPGIPNLMPGEEITGATLEFLRETAAAPFGWVRGALDEDVTHVRVVAR
ncbi:MAG TPA: aminotransferase class V-fold PLP-dependent enzyme [Candidatus Angelobacter sp.]|nr:aminotransferase class V-fold PLP-dependent enzyme [Candidatus Angelobacter sp.]